jgi:hypothetical protein
MSLESLPQVLLDHIASFVEARDLTGLYPYQWRSRPSCLPQLATVSRKWQLAIEQRTFRSLQPLTSDELDEFENIVGGQSNRQRYLHDLSYTIHLDCSISFRPNNYGAGTENGEYMKKKESAQEQNANNESFSNAIRKLFTILKSWEDKSLGVGRLRIYVGEALARDQIRPLTGIAEWASTQNSSMPRFANSYLRIVDLDTIEPVQGVTTLVINRSSSKRKLYWTVAVDLLTKLPNITTTNIELNDDYTRDSNIRREKRYDFSFALQTALRAKMFPALRTVRLDLPNDSTRNQNLRPFDLMMKSTPTVDPISEGVRTLSYNLTNLQFDGLIEPTFFWSDSITSNSTESLWPRLEELVVKFHIETPSGGWYFKSPREPDEEEDVVNVSAVDEADAVDDSNEDPEEVHGDTDSDLFTSSGSDESDFQREDPEDTSWMKFRTDPTHKAEKLLEAFARACTKMPKLQYASLTTIIEQDRYDGSNMWEWGVDYVAAGQQHSIDGVDDCNAGNRRLYWQVKDWRPTARIWDLCRGIGSEQHSARMDERFLDRWS